MVFCYIPITGLFFRSFNHCLFNNETPISVTLRLFAYYKENFTGFFVLCAL